MKAKKTKILSLAFTLAFATTAISGLAVLGASAADGDDTPPASEPSWVAVSGVTDQEGNATTVAPATVTSTKDTTKENKIVIRSQKEYSDGYYLTYSVSYKTYDGEVMNNGHSGVVLNSTATDELDGYYLSFYSADILRSASGWYSNGTFTERQTGDPCGWGGDQGTKTLTYSIYVQNDLAIAFISDGGGKGYGNAWYYANFPVSHTTGNYVSLVTYGADATYSNMEISELPQDFDAARYMLRSQYRGTTMVEGLGYRSSQGNDHMFKMQLPEDTTGVSKYYLARTAKMNDGNQQVDVLVDPTGEKTIDSNDWGTKVATWDSPNEYRTCMGWHSYEGSHAPWNTVGTTMVELPASAFMGATAGSKVGIYLDKNVDGWYSATAYWFLYEDSAGKLRVADYFELLDEAACVAHDLASKQVEVVGTAGCDRIWKYGFINQEIGSGHPTCQQEYRFIAFKRGEEAKFFGSRVLPKQALNISIDLAKDKEAKTSYTLNDIKAMFDIDLGVYAPYANYALWITGGAQVTDAYTFNKTETGSFTMDIEIAHQDGKDKFLMPDGVHGIYNYKISVEVPFAITCSHTEATRVVEPTCTAKGHIEHYCTVCGAKTADDSNEVAALGHNLTEGATTAPTCTEGGYTEYTCSRCDYKERRNETAATGHTEVDDDTKPAVAPTCTQKGKTQGTKCSVCGEVIKAQEEVAAKGHTSVDDAAVAPTCTEKGKTVGSHCSECNEVLVAQQEVAALGHQYADNHTCHERACTRSGCNHKEAATTEHTWGEPVKEGKENKYTCTDCGETKTEPVKGGCASNATGGIVAIVAVLCPMAALVLVCILRKKNRKNS